MNLNHWQLITEPPRRNYSANSLKPEMVAMRKRGMTMKAISEKLGVSRSAVERQIGARRR